MNHPFCLFTLNPLRLFFDFVFARGLAQSCSSAAGTAGTASLPAAPREPPGAPGGAPAVCPAPASSCACWGRALCCARGWDPWGRALSEGITGLPCCIPIALPGRSAVAEPRVLVAATFGWLAVPPGKGCLYPTWCEDKSWEGGD